MSGDNCNFDPFLGLFYQNFDVNKVLCPLFGVSTVPLFESLKQPLSSTFDSTYSFQIECPKTFEPRRLFIRFTLNDTDSGQIGEEKIGQW